MTDGRICLRVRVAGRVQGVWFRGWTRQTATALGLTGWVRNRSDGSVEAVFCGPRRAVEMMVEACRRGPPAADVHSLTVDPAEDPELARFEQRGAF